jgi:hypothetical protein
MAVIKTFRSITGWTTKGSRFTDEQRLTAQFYTCLDLFCLGLSRSGL